MLYLGKFFHHFKDDNLYHLDFFNIYLFNLFNILKLDEFFIHRCSFIVPLIGEGYLFLLIDDFNGTQLHF